MESRSKRKAQEGCEVNEDAEEKHAEDDTHPLPEHCPEALPEEQVRAAAALFGLRRGAQVLLVGEGNLTFASALLALDTGAEIVATTFERLEEHASRIHGSARDRLCAGGVAVAHGVDATDLAGTLPEELRRPYDRIIFQFPQHPERRKIHRHRELLRAFFVSATKSCLARPAGEVVVSLCKGQGGTAAESARHPKDTWQVQDAAAEGGLLLRLVEPCPLEVLIACGYKQTGFRGRGMRDATAEQFQDRPFSADGSLTHVFSWDDAGATAAYPVRLQHDISFWVPEDFNETAFAQVVRRLCGERLEPELTLLDRYCRPDDGRAARTYRIAVSAVRRAITQHAWRSLCESIRTEVSAVGASPRS